MTPVPPLDSASADARRRERKALFVARMVIWFSAALGISLTAGLGMWQMGRADEKLTRQAERDQRAAQTPWQAADWPCQGEASALPAQQPVRLAGQWWHERSVLLDNRPMGGQTGFILVTPLRVQAPAACADRVILVQRGWLPRHASDRTQVPEWPQPDGLVEVVGRFEPVLSRVYELGDEGMPQGGGTTPIRQNAAEPFWAAWLGQAARPGVMVQTEGDPAMPADPLRRDWPAPDDGVDKHHGYAAQWFALSALLAGLTIWFQIIRPARARAAQQRDVQQS